MPSKPGVYIFLDNNNTILYVGKAKDLKARVSSYFNSPTQLGEKTKALVGQIQKIRTTEVESELEALLLEAHYIKKYNPRYNIRLTDNKAYVMIRITGCIDNRLSGFSSQLSESRFSVVSSSDEQTDRQKTDELASENRKPKTDNRVGVIIKDPYPVVTLARRSDDPNSIYFGPYPSSAAVRQVLKLIRRAFPYQSVPNHPKRICLYNHLGLCLCPPVNDSAELRRVYRYNIKNIIRILEGKSKVIIKELEKQRDNASNAELYEIALNSQKKINALSYITQPFRRPVEYEVNPNLRVDIRRQELESLQQILTENGCPIDYPAKIECYDISNIQGTNAVGSMVVFVDGEKESGLYRKYKIRRDYLKNVISTNPERRDPTQKHTDQEISLRQRPDRNDKRELPNDFAMMHEVLSRRLKHEEWDYPQLIIVDGGKGQVSSALQALEKIGVKIPLVGLAKREETIVIPIRDGEGRMAKGEEKFKEVSLPKDTGALQLMMRLRDEAHRFAITYHRKLRSKAAVL